METAVLVTIADGVASVVLNRPDRQNAWNGEMGRRYFETLEALAADERVRVIVVSGAGGAFCVGGDPDVLGGIAKEGGHAVAEQRPYWLPLTIAKPIIAAIAGPCFGLGLLVALCCDIRFAAEDARIATAYARRGVVAEMGMSWLLPRIVGLGRAADLLLSGRAIRAAEALEMGLVSRVFPAADLEAEALAYARTLASQCAPTSMRLIKGQLYDDLDGGLPAAYDRSTALLDQAFASPDFAEGVASWRERRAPAFPPLPPEFGRLGPAAGGRGD
jgi:enoyl-CoA hydratase/carnithine racemase